MEALQTKGLGKDEDFVWMGFGMSWDRGKCPVSAAGHGGSLSKGPQGSPLLLAKEGGPVLG